jgi:REP element-mobilizing transposase RayT
MPGHIVAIWESRRMPGHIFAIWESKCMPGHIFTIWESKGMPGIDLFANGKVLWEQFLSLIDTRHIFFLRVIYI